MTLKGTLEQNLQKHFDYKKQHEFFVVEPALGSFPKPRPYQERLDKWLSLCDTTHLDLKDYFVEGNGTTVLLFKNGLEVADNGRKVAFSAIDSKEKVNMDSARLVLRCAANHLCRRGWDTGVDFSTVRYGAAQMVLTFEKAYKEARQMLNAERIALLKNTQRKG